MALEQKRIKDLDFTDEKSFEKLFRSNYQALANFALKYVGDKDISEEVVQEVFSHIWQKGNQIEVKTNLKSYLYRSVRNYCLNYLKHKKVEKNYVDRTLHTADRSNNSDTLELEELRSHISSAIEKLPPKCREIFELNRFEQKKYKEISEELKISLKTVENQMGKALKILRKQLKHLLPLLVLILSELILQQHGGKL